MSRTGNPIYNRVPKMASDDDGNAWNVHTVETHDAQGDPVRFIRLTCELNSYQRFGALNRRAKLESDLAEAINSERHDKGKLSETHNDPELAERLAERLRLHQDRQIELAEELESLASTMTDAKTLVWEFPVDRKLIAFGVALVEAGVAAVAA